MNAIRVVRQIDPRASARAPISSMISPSDLTGPAVNSRSRRFSSNCIFRRSSAGAAANACAVSESTSSEMVDVAIRIASNRSDWHHQLPSLPSGQSRHNRIPFWPFVYPSVIVTRSIFPAAGASRPRPRLS